MRASPVYVRGSPVYVRGSPYGRANMGGATCPISSSTNAYASTPDHKFILYLSERRGNDPVSRKEEVLWGVQVFPVQTKVDVRK